MSTFMPEQTPQPSPEPAGSGGSRDQKKPENVFVSLVFNILLPVLILNKLEKWVPEVGPWGTLFIALAFPLGAAVKDLLTRKKVSPMSGLGALNVIGTGGLAALGLGGIWFAIKEAFFPFVIGIGVLISAYMRKPAAETLFFSDAIFHVDKIRIALIREKNELEFKKSLRSATLLLAGSFFLSSALNFALAMSIFEPLATTLSQAERAQVLNQQVARMTWMSFAVIALPSFICTATAFWGMLRSVRRLTGLTDAELFKE